MRPLLGPLAVHTGLVAAGLGLLRALNVIPGLRSSQALAAVGLAYLVGAATTLAVCTILLVLGAPFTLPVFSLVAVAMASPLALDLRPGRPTAPRPSRRVTLGPGGWAILATLVALVVLALIGFATLGNRPIGPVHTDAWNQLTRKALLLVASPHLPTEIFSFSGDQRFLPHYNINASYPLLLPLLEALHLRALGRVDPQAIHLVLWLLAIAFVWAGGFLASRVTTATVWVPVLAGVVMLSLPRLLSGYADVPLGYYLGLGVLAVGLWLRSGRRRELGAAVALLAGAAQMKNEGTAGALLVVLLLIAALLVRRQPRRAGEAAAAGILLGLVAILPWRLWVQAHHLQTEVPLARIANPGFLSGSSGRVGPSLSSLGGQLIHAGGAVLFTLVGLVVVLVCLRERSRRLLAIFYLAVGVGYFAALVWSFWINTLSLPFLTAHAAPRLVIPLGFIAVAAVLQLSSPQGLAGSPSSV